MVMFRVVSLLEKSKAFADSAFAAMPGAVFALDKHFRILRCNEDAAKILNETADSVNGRSIGEIFERNDYEIIKPLLLNLFQGQAETFEIEAAIHDELGKRDFHWEFRRFTVGSKATHSIVNVVGRDITVLKQTMKAKVEFEKDLDLASSTQNLLLPDKNEVENESWRFSAHFEPAVKAGGDWWKYDMRPDGSVVIFLGDVTGHGVASAMVTAMILGSYKTLLKLNPAIDIEVFISEFDHQLKHLMNGKYWMTLFALDLHPQEGYFDWYCAAAPSVFVISKDGATEELTAPGRPLGSGELHFHRGRQNIKPGDRIFCATDGVFELHQDVNEMAVRRAVLKILKQMELSPTQVKNQIKNKITQLRMNRPVQDDTSFIVFDVLGTEKNGIKKHVKN